MKNEINSELLDRVERRAAVLIENCPPEEMSIQELFALWTVLQLKKQIEQGDHPLQSVDSEQLPEVGYLGEEIEEAAPRRRPGRPKTRRATDGDQKKEN